MAQDTWPSSQSGGCEGDDQTGFYWDMTCLLWPGVFASCLPRRTGASSPDGRGPWYILEITVFTSNLHSSSGTGCSTGMYCAFDTGEVKQHVISAPENNAGSVVNGEKKNGIISLIFPFALLVFYN